jgi:Protein of unknown function (DUF3429)
MSEKTDVTTTERLAWILGLLGLLPFAGQTLFAWISPIDEAAGVMRSQVLYAAVILSFIGALHWGVVIASADIVDARAARRLLWSVVPALFGWLAALYKTQTALAALWPALLVALAVDVLLYRGTSVPRWFVLLRTVLALGASLAVGMTWLAARLRLID